MNTTTTTVVQWMAGSGVLVALLVAAAWIDWRTMRIPNWLTVGGVLYGLAWSTLTAYSALNGLGVAALGMLVGFLLLPLYAIRVLGAGDVKLMAMVGTFLGPGFTLVALLFSLIFGGLAALYFAVSHRAINKLASNLRDMAVTAALPGAPMWRPELSGQSIGRLPYGASIAMGTIAAVLARQFGYF